MAITACGGGGGGSSDDGDGSAPITNAAPTVSAPATSVAESASVAITATASDSDGSIASYSWSQKSGPQLNLTDADTATVTVTAPSMTEDGEAILTITVTDDDGATAQADITVTITANKLNFTVRGVVVDTPGADIEVTVGSQRFQTIADSDGAYSIPLSLDESLADSMVTASAQSASAGQLHYVSVLGEVGVLDTAAGADDTLTMDENVSVNLSAISTAISAQLNRANGGDITSQSALESAGRMIDSEIVFNVATSITLALEYTDDPALKLPAESADTFAFASDLEVSAAHGVNARLTNQDLWDSTQVAIAVNPELVVSQPSDSTGAVADTYYFTAPKYSFTGAFNGSRLVLSADGNGIMSDTSDESTFNWALGENGVSFDGLELVSSEGYPWDSDLGKQVHEQTITRVQNLRWLSRSKLSDVLLFEIESYTHYPDGEYPDTAPVAWLSTGTAIKTASKISAADILQLGVDYSLSRPITAGEVVNPVEGSDPYLDISASRISFSGTPGQGGTASVTVESSDGDGTLITGEESANWVIAADGSLQVTYANGDSSNLVFLSENPTASGINVRTTRNSDVFTQTGRLLLKGESAWTALSAVGIYQYAFDFFRPLEHFWFEVNDDGTALTVSTYDSDQNGSLEDNEYFLMPGLWRINGEGNLLIRRYRYNQGVAANGGYCKPASWDPADGDECVLYHEREWNLHQTDGSDGYWMHHYHRFFSDWYRNSMPDPSVSGHIFMFGTIDNRAQYKTDVRPAEIPPHLLP
ncbi:PKD domain-containing protein [Microbulbifer marinus]|nr:hypothetical protein [Microbulbifer marinus]